MKHIDSKNKFESEFPGKTIILAASAVLVYMLASLYFMSHFFFNTEINGLDVSLMAHEAADEAFISYVENYRLQLIEKNGETEEILGQDIEMKYSRENSISEIYKDQTPYKWVRALFKKHTYYISGLYLYNKGSLGNKISGLNCLNTDIIEPRNVSFRYAGGGYEAVEEVYGNKLHTERLYQVIELSILRGQNKLDLDKNHCYENPKYTLSSDKTSQTLGLLNKYLSAKITYILRSKSEVLDHNKINQWLSIDEDLEAVIKEEAVRDYVKGLSKKYDTVGIARKFKTSSGKTIEVKGGFYGWRINVEDEALALLENIRCGEVLEKEPIYIQTAMSGGENDIGNTYVEINLTRQYLWFYKHGRLIARGAIVSGNPNTGNATETGVYMLNYKQTGSTLRGPGYEAGVTYWMPFNGNIGIHDASWRYSFGREIYKVNGSHGCINVPVYLAKKIFDSIEEGTPIICYEE